MNIPNFNFRYGKYITLLAFLLLSIAIAVYLASQRQEIRNQAAEISVSQLNNQIIKESNRNILEGLALQRKKILQQYLTTNPSLFSQYSFSPEQIKNLPQFLKDKNLIEKEISTTGILSVMRIDQFKQNTSSSEYVLQTQPNNLNSIYILRFTDKPTDEFLIGKEYSVSGLALDSQIYVTDFKENEKIDLDVPLQLNNTNQLVILFNFTNDTKQPFTKTEINQILFTGDKSAKNYYIENSSNQLQLRGDVIGWYTIDVIDQADCMYGRYYQWAEKANQLAQQQGVNLNNYSYKMYVFPYTEACRFSGIANISGSLSFINGSVTPYVFIHELGHNFGLDHAGSINCGGKPIDDYSKCSFSEYGDQIDIMGFSENLNNLSTANRTYLEWIPPEQVLDVEENGDFTVIPILSQNIGYKVLRIYKPDTNEHYYIEYRQRQGFDETLDEDNTDGVLIRIRNDYSKKTNLIDSTFEYTHDTSAVALKDNSTFIDERNGIIVQQLRHGQNEAVVSIQFTKPKYYTFDIPLNTGWNLISFPLILKNNNIQEVLSPLENKLDEVQTYEYYYVNEGFVQKFRWITYQPNRTEEENTLKTIENTKAYYIKMKEPSVLSIRGDKPRFTVIQLEKGFNLIAYPSLKPRTVLEALKDIKGNYSVVYGLDPSQNPPTQIYIPNNQQNTLLEFKPGLGYKIFINNKTQITFLEPVD